jgi:hypothetical protein
MKGEVLGEGLKMEGKQWQSRGRVTEVGIMYGRGGQ